MSSEVDKTIALEEFKVLAQRAGLRLSREELRELEPIYESLRRQIESLYQIELDDQGPEVVFSADWTPGE